MNDDDRVLRNCLGYLGASVDNIAKLIEQLPDDFTPSGETLTAVEDFFDANETLLNLITAKLLTPK